jgi:hypothetical protein
VPAPKKLRAAISESCLVTLTWRGMKAAKLAGYRVYVSEDAPDRQRGNHIRLAGDGPPIRQGDMVFVCHQVNNFSRTRDVHGFRWGAGSFGRGAYTLIRDYSDEMANGRWERVPHPGALPKEFADGGETCLKLDLEDGAPFTIGMYSYAGTSQSWYPVLQPGRTYVAEGWVRYVGQGAGKLTFALRGHYDRKPPSQGGVAPVTYQATREWTRFRTTFSPGFLMESGGVGRMEFAFTGPGTFWVDNLRIYPEKPGYLRPEPLVVQRTRESGLDAIRFHTHIKSGWGQTMVMLTDPPGVMGCRGHDRPNSPFTLPALLDFCRTGGANPWLQVEMSMSEREWLGLVEYLAAPYNPATDTPEAKPWAFKRFRQGQPKPWTDEFERVYFEISNETWNGLFGPWTFGWGETMTDQATGKTYRYGELYGLFQEYVLGVLRSSPHWTSGMAGKFRSVMGGWAVSRGVDGYGGLAIRHSPSTDYLTIGGYNGGWDEGEKPAEPTNEGFFRAITFWLQNEERTREHLLTRETLVKQALAHRYAFGTYEAGPGYALSGLNKQARMTREQVEAQDQVGKSLANGVATLDAFLGRAQLGFTIQNFFTLNFKRSHWTSHAPVYKGGQPYPSWMALALYNNHGTGDFLATEALSAPTRDLSGYKRRRAREDAPLVAVYATRQGRRVNVFVLSRKLDGYPDPRDDGFTPVTLRLPFTRAGSVTLMKMAGDPRAHNLDEWVVQVQKKEGLPFAAPFRLTRATTDEAKDGLPPGSVLLYIFEGTDAAPAQMPSTPQSSRQRDT